MNKWLSLSYISYLCILNKNSLINLIKGLLHDNIRWKTTENKRKQYRYAQTQIYRWMFFIWNSHTKHCLFTKNTLAAFQSYEITKSTWTREEFDRKLNKAVSWSCMVIIQRLPMVIYVIISWDTHATKAFQQLKTQKFHKFLVNISREKM